MFCFVVPRHVVAISLYYVLYIQQLPCLPKSVVSPLFHHISVLSLGVEACSLMTARRRTKKRSCDIVSRHGQSQLTVLAGLHGQWQRRYLAAAASFVAVEADAVKLMTERTDVVCTLASLTSLALERLDFSEEWTADLFGVLTAPSHSMLANLRSINLSSCTLSGAPAWPARAGTGALQPPHLSSLRSLTSLDLEMNCGGEEDGLTAAALVMPHLGGCARLTNTCFSRFSFAAADVQELLTALPELQ